VTAQVMLWQMIEKELGKVPHLFQRVNLRMRRSRLESGPHIRYYSGLAVVGCDSPHD